MQLLQQPVQGSLFSPGLCFWALQGRAGRWDPPPCVRETLLTENGCGTSAGAEQDLGSNDSRQSFSEPCLTLGKG